MHGWMGCIDAATQCGYAGQMSGIRCEGRCCAVGYFCAVLCYLIDGEGWRRRGRRVGEMDCRALMRVIMLGWEVARARGWAGGIMGLGCELGLVLRVAVLDGWSLCSDLVCTN